MYESIHTRLARVPDEAILFPGHLYSQDPSQSMGDTRRWNYVFRPRSARGVDGHVRVVSRVGRIDRGQHGRRRRRVARRMASRRDAARRGLRRLHLAGRRGAAPSLRPAAPVQAGAGRDVATREGGAGGQAALERAPGPRGARPPRRRASTRRRGRSSSTTAPSSRATPSSSRPAPRPARSRAPRISASATACSRCAPSTTRSPCAPPSRRWTTARVVVIGAGFIGAEVASTCAGLGCRVTVLEALDVPLRNVLGPDDRIALRVAARSARCATAHRRGRAGIAATP